MPSFPVGLTFVTGLKRRTTKLTRNRDKNVAQFIGLAVPPPEEWKRTFNLGSESWNAVRRRLGRS